MPTWTIQLAPQQLLRVHQRAVRLTPYLGIVRRPPHDVRQPGRERALRQSVAEGGWVVHRHHLVRLAHHPRWDVSRSEDLGRTREPHEDDIHNDTHRAHQVGGVAWRCGVWTCKRCFDLFLEASYAFNLPCYQSRCLYKDASPRFGRVTQS